MLHTRMTSMLGVEHPIISAPMAGTAGADLAAAVSAAGGFGLIGGSSRDAPWLRDQIRIVRERTDKPFGVGFISSFAGLDELVEVALEARVAAIAHSFADPTPYVAAAHRRGVKLLAQVQTVAQAEVATEAGVDVIAAQGTEAGGHTGYTATFPLVPAVVAVAGTIPVVAAGGIADGRGLAAALMLGAEGAWIGTRFVATPEGMIAGWVKDAVVRAGTDDTVLTRAYDLAMGSAFPPGIGDRVIRNEWNTRWHGQDEAVVAQREALRAEVQHAIEPAGDIVRRIVAEAAALLRSRPTEVLRDV
jgi:nitronate monooxygenase